VIEAKDKKGSSQRSILDELDRAMGNREALAAIAVFAKEGRAANHDPLQIFGNRIFVVFDRDELDPLALRVACLLARWSVKRSLSSSAADIDTARIESCIEAIRRALGRATTLRRCHSTARNSISQASEQLGDLVQEIEVAIWTMEAEISKGGDG
jgi:hypothetical protein